MKTNPHLLFYFLPVFFILASFLFTAQAQSLQFDGVDDDARLANLPALAGAFTVECWVNYDPSDAGAMPFKTIWSLDDGASSPWLGINALSAPTRLEFYNNSSTLLVQSGAAFGSAGWYHIAFSWDGFQSRLFIDGIAVGNSSNPPTVPDGFMQIGDNRDTPPGGGASFKGRIDEFRISNIARHTANFAPAAFEFAPDANTVALYHFNENGGQTVADASVNALHLQLGISDMGDQEDPLWSLMDTPVAPTPPPTPPPVPTLSQWGLLILSLLFLAFGVIALQQRVKVLN